MQTTLDIASPSVPNVDVTNGNSTLIVSEEHREHLYRTFCPSFLEEEQIINHLLEEKAEKKAEEEDVKETFEYLQQFKDFQPKRKQEYIRVGKKR